MSVNYIQCRGGEAEEERKDEEKRMRETTKGRRPQRGEGGVGGM